MIKIISESQIGAFGAMDVLLDTITQEVFIDPCPPPWVLIKAMVQSVLRRIRNSNKRGAGSR